MNYTCLFIFISFSLIAMESQKKSNLKKSSSFLSKLCCYQKKNKQRTDAKNNTLPNSNLEAKNSNTETKKTRFKKNEKDISSKSSSNASKDTIAPYPLTYPVQYGFTSDTNNHHHHHHSYTDTNSYHHSSADHSTTTSSFDSGCYSHSHH
jgi:hypothetical protein